ncbi:MAG: hypothetical protein Kow0037_13500 [Calditrichia bacterium]
MSYAFYLDPEKKKINPDLLDKEAKNIAASLLGTVTDRRGREKNVQVSSHQLRKFYNEVKSLEKKTKMFGWDTAEPMVRMVKAKISYATAESKIDSSERKYYRNFKNFLTKGIDSIKDEKDFSAFCKFFEAVVGYYYGEGGK